MVSNRYCLGSLCLTYDITSDWLGPGKMYLGNAMQGASLCLDPMIQYVIPHQIGLAVEQINIIMPYIQCGVVISVVITSRKDLEVKRL